MNTTCALCFWTESVHLQVLMSVALLVLLLLLLLLATMLLPPLPQLQLARARVARLLHLQLQPLAKTLLLPHLLLPVAIPQVLLQLLLQLTQKLLLLHQLLLLLAAVLMLPVQLLLAVATMVAAQAIQVGALARQAKGHHPLEVVPSPRTSHSHQAVARSPQAWAQVPLQAHINHRPHTSHQVQKHIWDTEYPTASHVKPCKVETQNGFQLMSAAAVKTHVCHLHS